MTAHLTITRPGLSAVTDLGRTGAGRVGQLSGGALDQHSARVANALVGAAPANPVIEAVAMDFAAHTPTDLLIAVTGASARVAVDGIAMPTREPFVWPAGTELVISGIHDGLRTYVAVHGELLGPRLLGSVAPDSVLGFSGPLRRGQRIAVRPDTRLLHNPFLDVPVFRLRPFAPTLPDSWAIPITDGPDRAQFGATADALLTGGFVVGPKSNHIGLRLTAAPDARLPVRESSQEVLSRGVPIGAVEVPAGDELLILHRGRGVTAGYPVLAVVTSLGLSRLAQAREGQRVTFVRQSVTEAVAAARDHERRLDQLRYRVAAILDAHAALLTCAR